MKQQLASDEGAMDYHVDTAGKLQAVALASGGRTACRASFPRTRAADREACCRHDVGARLPRDRLRNANVVG